MERNPHETRSFARLPDELKTHSWTTICDAGRLQTKVPGQFMTTDWPLITGGAAGAAHALDALARAYWFPLKSYARRRLRSEEDAEDAVQSFMLRLMDPAWLARADSHKGKFRAFMLTSFKHLIIDLHRKHKPEPLPPPNERELQDFPDENTPSPDAEFEAAFYQDWAHTLIDLAFQHLEEMEIALGHGELFAELSPHLSDPHDLAGVARRTGTPLGSIKVYLHRWKKRLRELTVDEVRRTLDNPTDDDVQAEWAFLQTHL